MNLDKTDELKATDPGTDPSREVDAHINTLTFVADNLDAKTANLFAEDIVALFEGGLVHVSTTVDQRSGITEIVWEEV